MNTTEAGIMVTNGDESSLVSEVKEKQDKVPYFSLFEGECSLAKSIVF